MYYHDYIVFLKVSLIRHCLVYPAVCYMYIIVYEIINLNVYTKLSEGQRSWVSPPLHVIKHPSHMVLT